MTTDHNPIPPSDADLQPPLQQQSFEPNPNWRPVAVLEEAWELSNGYKKTFWGANFIYIGVTIGLVLVFMLLSFMLSSAGAGVVLGLVQQIATTLVTIPIIWGMGILGIRRATGEQSKASMVLEHYSRLKTIAAVIGLLILAILAVALVITISFMMGDGFGKLMVIAAVIAGFHLMILHNLVASLLLLEPQRGIVDAIKKTWLVMQGNWFNVSLFYFATIVITIMGAIPFGIGLIWTSPWVNVAQGVLYRELFGVSPDVN